MSTTTRPAPASCPRCSQRLAPGGTVRLWDGVDYCRECVDRACPGLADYARSHETLAETVRFDRDRYVRELREGMVQALVVVVAAIAVVAWIAFDGSVTPFVALAAVILAVGGLLLLRIHREADRIPRYLPTVRVRDGVVSVVRPYASEQVPTLEFPLGEARWFLGRRVHDSVTKSLRRTSPAMPHAGRPAIVLKAPMARAGVLHPSRRTICGTDPEMRRLWIGFLRLAGVPEDYPRGASRPEPPR